MGTLGNMQLDQSLIDQVLAAIQRGKLPTSTPPRSAPVRQVSIPKAKTQPTTPARRSKQGTDDVTTFLKKRGLEAWCSHLTIHLNIKTVAHVKAITAIDLRRLATAANMRLDQKTINQVLTAIDLKRP